MCHFFYSPNRFRTLNSKPVSRFLALQSKISIYLLYRTTHICLTDYASLKLGWSQANNSITLTVICWQILRYNCFDRKSILNHFTMGYKNHQCQNSFKNVFKRIFNSLAHTFSELKLFIGFGKFYCFKKAIVHVSFHLNPFGRFVLYSEFFLLFKTRSVLK